MIQWCWSVKLLQMIKRAFVVLNLIVLQQMELFVAVLLSVTVCEGNNQMPNECLFHFFSHSLSILSIE